MSAGSAAGGLSPDEKFPPPPPAERGHADEAIGRVRGAAEIGFALRSGATRLAHLYQHDPLRVLFPETARGDLPTAALVTTSGGLVAGDRLSIAVELGIEAAAHITASAAEKIYRSAGMTTEIAQSLAAEAGAWLEYLPPETILFDGARLRRHTVLSLAPTAGFLGGGIIVFGRRARGERFTRGLLHDAWEVRRDGELVWGDALHLDGDMAAIMADPACFADAAACATLVLGPPGGDPQRFLDLARAALRQSASPALHAAATAVNGILVCRWLGPDPLPLRRSFADLACDLRAAAMGLPARLPRLWHV